MNLKGLIEAAARRTCCQSEAKGAVQEMLSQIRKALKEGERVHLKGVGTLFTRTRAPRTITNPKTGERHAIPPRRVARFKASGRVLK